MSSLSPAIVASLVRFRAHQILIGLALAHIVILQTDTFVPKSAGPLCTAQLFPQFVAVFSETEISIDNVCFAYAMDLHQL